MVRTTYSPKTAQSPDYVTAWDVKQFTYCPIIPWIKENIGVVEPPDINMMLGKPEGPKEEILEELNVPKPWRYEIHLKNQLLRISGVVDVVGGVKRFEVVEFKLFTRRRYDHFTTQLLFYAYLVSKTLGPVARAHMLLGRKTITYQVSDDVLKQVEKLVRKVREAKTSEDPPVGRRLDPRKCSLCWYRRYCPNT
ncbi:MAG: CRISPR-associated protein Cas4 [Desulfurococcaceae archaeon]